MASRLLGAAVQTLPGKVSLWKARRQISQGHCTMLAAGLYRSVLVPRRVRMHAYITGGCQLERCCSQLIILCSRAP